MLPQRKEDEVGEVVVATLDELALEELVLWEHPPVRECVFVFVFLYLCVCLCVCVREKERESECVCEREGERESE